MAGGGQQLTYLGPSVPGFPPQITEAQIVERFGSLSSASIRRIIDAGAEVIERRAEDGVFE